MPRRSSEGAKILRFFDTEPLDKVRFVFDMVRDVVAARVKAANPQPIKKAATRRKKPNANLPQATAEQKAATSPEAD